MYSEAFEAAVNHAMIYEVGGFWKLTPEVEAGLITNNQQRRAVGYTKDPNDHGGETKFGIAKNANPDVDVTNLTWAEAKEIYYKKYWLAGHCDKMPGRVAALHFDGCVNAGIKRSNILLQRALGVDDDGVVGQQTLGAIAAADAVELCHAISNERNKFYQAIVANNPTQSIYINGWTRRVEEMREFACADNDQFLA